MDQCVQVGKDVKSVVLQLVLTVPLNFAGVLTLASTISLFLGPVGYHSEKKEKEKRKEGGEGEEGEEEDEEGEGEGRRRRRKEEKEKEREEGERSKEEMH